MRWDITTFIRLITIISVGLCAATGSVADEKFRVKNLPGLPTAASFDQFAGYIDVGEDVNGSKNKMFFWMMESRSAPASDPVVIWLSGGPGCSSVAAQMEENGPLHLQGDGSMINNPNGWNSHANLVYLDQPLQTGLSFSGDDSLIYEQYQATTDFKVFLKGFYKAFPNFKGRDLYISGESYAGHFIPAFATSMLSDPSFDKAGIHLKGVAIGNGWIDPLTHITAAPQVAHAAGVINISALGKINEIAKQAVAGIAPDVGNFGSKGDGEPLQMPSINFMTAYDGLEKLPVALQGNSEATALKALLNAYKGEIIAVKFSNVDFIKMIDLIVRGPEDLRSILPPLFTFLFNGASNDQLLYRYLIARVVAESSNSDGNAVNLMDLANFGPVSMIGTPTAWPAGDSVFQDYMNNTETLTALNATAFGKRTVIPCNPLLYTSLTGDYYQSAAPSLLKVLAKIPVLLYNGQDDLIVSASSTQKLLLKLASDEDGPPWPGKKGYADAQYQPWIVDNEFAGYYQNSGNLHYLSVLDASHMVPLSQPKNANVMIRAFISGQPIVD